MKRRWKSHAGTGTGVGRVPRDSQTPLSRNGANFFDLHLDHHRARHSLVREHSRECFLMRFMTSRCCRKMETKNATRRESIASLYFAATGYAIFTKQNPFLYFNYICIWQQNKFNMLKITIRNLICISCYSECCGFCNSTVKTF